MSSTKITVWKSSCSTTKAYRQPGTITNFLARYSRNSSNLKLTSLAHDTLHNMSLDLRTESNKLRGRVNLAITISGVDKASTNKMEEKFELASTGKIYNISKTLSDFPDIGILKVVLHSASNLKVSRGLSNFRRKG